jgi:hypothetical protein
VMVIILFSLNMWFCDSSSICFYLWHCF